MKIQTTKRNKGLTKEVLILIIFLIFMILCVCLGIVVFTDSVNANSTNSLQYRFSLMGNNYTKENLKSFLQSANECKNYSFEFYEGTNKITGKVYNNKHFYSTDYEDAYYNSSTKKYIKISKKDKIYKVTMSEFDYNYTNVLANIVLTFLDYDNSTVKFIKNEVYKDLDCIVEKISLDSIEDLENSGLFNTEQLEILQKYKEKKIKISYDFWIHKETGLIPKYEVVIESVDKKEDRIEFDTNLSLNTVTEKDIKEPNEDDYRNNGYNIIKK